MDGEDEMILVEGGHSTDPKWMDPGKVCFANLDLKLLVAARNATREK